MARQDKIIQEVQKYIEQSEGNVNTIELLKFALSQEELDYFTGSQLIDFAVEIEEIYSIEMGKREEILKNIISNSSALMKKINNEFN